MRPLLVSAVLVATALGLSACGRTNDDDGATTRAQFITKTDTACKASNRRTRTLNLQLARAAAGARGDRELLRRLAPVLRRGAGGVTDNAAAFKVAAPPAGDTAKIAGIRRLYEQQAELVRTLASAAARGDVSGFKARSEEQKDVATRARRLTRAYGFRECGSTKSDARRPPAVSAA